MAIVKKQAVRTSVDIPTSYIEAKAQAAAQGRSVRELILLGVRVTWRKASALRAKRVKFPLIDPKVRRSHRTNEQI